MDEPAFPTLPFDLEREMSRFKERSEAHHRIMMLLDDDLERQLAKPGMEPWKMVLATSAVTAALSADGAAIGHFFLR